MKSFDTQELRKIKSTLVRNFDGEYSTTNLVKKIDEMLIESLNPAEKIFTCPRCKAEYLYDWDDDYYFQANSMIRMWTHTNPDGSVHQICRCGKVCAIDMVDADGRTIFNHPAFMDCECVTL